MVSKNTSILRCSDNNLAETVLPLFKAAVHEYGFPPCVRCDRGVENVEVSFFLLCHPLCGPGRGSVLVGKSVHNQRIERMWRVIYQGNTRLYYSLFYHLEDINLLNPSNKLHLFCFIMSSSPESTGICNYGGLLG